MVKRITIALAVIFGAVLLFMAYRLYDRFPWLEAAVYAHSDRGSPNCGHLTNSSYEPHVDPDPVIRCVVSAHQQHRLFFVTLLRHLHGDWGDLDQEDKTENELSLKYGFRLLSSYQVTNTEKIWTITEADRSVTTLLRPAE